MSEHPECKSSRKPVNILPITQEIISISCLPHLKPLPSQFWSPCSKIPVPVFICSSTCSKTANTNQAALGLAFTLPIISCKVVACALMIMPAFFFFIFYFLMEGRNSQPSLLTSTLNTRFSQKNEPKKLGLLKVFGCCMAQLQALQSSDFLQCLNRTQHAVLALSPCPPTADTTSAGYSAVALAPTTLSGRAQFWADTFCVLYLTKINRIRNK